MIESITAIEQGWGLALILWLQSWRTPLVEGAALAFHFLGSAAFYLPAVLLIYWSVDKHLGRRIAPFLMFAGWVNATMKSGFQRPRPFNVSSAVRNVITETGYGIPSGHAQNATVVGGIAANELRRWWILGITVAYAVLTGISRMILGVHYPQDVIVGIATGLLMLGIYALLEPFVIRWITGRSLAIQIAAAVIATALMLAVHPGLIPVTSPRWLPEELPLTTLLDTPLISAGGFLGFAIGIALEDRYVMFNPAGPWARRLLRALLGWVGIMVLYLALRVLLKGLLPELAAGTIRFGLIGLWAAFGAPWLFVRTGLATRTLKPDPYAEPQPEPAA